MKVRKSFNESSNPVMGDKVYRQNPAPRPDEFVPSLDASERMTVEGAVNKSLILGGLMLLTTMFSFSIANPILLWTGAIGSLVLVIWMSFRPKMSPILAPIYAGLEGLFVGSVSALYALSFGPTIIFHAVSLTLAILFSMLFVYKMGLIQVTQKFRSGVIMATMGIFLVYMLNLVLHFFGMSVPFLHEGGMMGIGISLFIIGIASLNLLLDFDNFEKGERYGAAKYMEWYSAMGLLVTLVWLYVEILRLLAIFAGED